MSVPAAQGELRWRCRRGMKELDLILGAYLSRCFDAASSARQAQFRRLLERADPELHALLVAQTLRGADAEESALLEEMCKAAYDA